ncbi:alpha/beta hydrolase family protein [Streptomyces sp. NBC_01255]|uniref:alpha/beta hydrolase n=1 Tax=Streptomyces sp. NBC_01255 TaxID=2903798 RepID=UPI002E3282F8|nr:alpha/beta hydrolase [Streptomyces sp. NBC_01255]
MTEHFAQLMKQDFADLDSAVGSWKKLADALSQTQTGSGRRVTGPLHKAGWTGVSATYGLEAMEATESKLGTGRTNAQLIATTLDTLNTKMQAAQRKLRAAVADAEAAGHTVRDDGWVESKQAVDPKYHNDPDYADAQRDANSGLGGFRARIDAAVAEAEAASNEGAEVLRQIDPFDLDKRYGGAHAQEDAARVAAFAGIDKKDIPDGTDPQRSADWWKGLDEEDKRMYLAAYPEQVGGLDGLPATTRDQANRTVLDMRLNDYAQREGDLGYHDRSSYQGLQKLKDRMDKSDTAPEHKQLHLLGFSTEGDGRAIVSVGNPDKAAHTAVSVPGTDNQLDNFTDSIDRAEKLQDSAGERTPGQGKDVAVIAWLDYDAPELDLGVVTPGRAEDDAETLRDFTHGLRASHEGERTHMTVVGHSYGSTMVGTADSGGQGLDTDDMIVVGSPGLNVDRADQLQVSPSRLWVGAAPDDGVVNWTADKTLGENPADPAFGGQQMYVDTSGHSGYWNDDSQSLANQGRIIAGKQPEGAPAS